MSRTSSETTLTTFGTRAGRAREFAEPTTFPFADRVRSRRSELMIAAATNPRTGCTSDSVSLLPLAVRCQAPCIRLEEAALLRLVSR